LRIAVYGAGAVGGYFGGRLAEAGEDVTLIARGEHLAALRERGLSVRSLTGDFHVSRFAATDDPETVGPADLVILGTKTWHVEEAALAMKPLVGEGTAIIPLQNGVEAPDQLARTLGPGPVLGGLCRIMSFVAEPGVIRHVGAEPVLTFGELDGSDSERCSRILRVLERAEGMRAEIAGDVRVEMWRKLQMMAATSGVGAAARQPFGVLLSVPETRRMLETCMREVWEVAVVRGINLSEDAANQAMTFLDGLPPDGTTSLYRDVDAGRPSELEAQLGAVVRLGSEAGVETPVCRTLYGVLLPAELNARGLR
jgi:2-dehydropantoate 2-reductase